MRGFYHLPSVFSENARVGLFIQLGRGPAHSEIVCTGLAAGFDSNDPVHVSATALREIPLQWIVSRIVRLFPDRILPAEKGTTGIREDAARLRARPGGKGLSDEELREFKRRYLVARRTNPKNPTKTLARELTLTDQAIRYRLQLAEKRLGRFRSPQPQKRKRGGRR